MMKLAEFLVLSLILTGMAHNAESGTVDKDAPRTRCDAVAKRIVPKKLWFRNHLKETTRTIQSLEIPPSERMLFLSIYQVYLKNVNATVAERAKIFAEVPVPQFLPVIQWAIPELNLFYKGIEKSFDPRSEKKPSVPKFTDYQLAQKKNFLENLRAQISAYEKMVASGRLTYKDLLTLGIIYIQLGNISGVLEKFGPRATVIQEFVHFTRNIILAQDEALMRVPFSIPIVTHEKHDYFSLKSFEIGLRPWEMMGEGESVIVDGDKFKKNNFTAHDALHDQSIYANSFWTRNPWRESVLDLHALQRWNHFTSVSLPQELQIASPNVRQLAILVWHFYIHEQVPDMFGTESDLKMGVQKSLANISDQPSNKRLRMEKILNYQPWPMILRIENPKDFGQEFVNSHPPTFGELRKAFQLIQRALRKSEKIR